MRGSSERMTLAARLQKAPLLQDERVNFIFNVFRNINLSLIPLLAGKSFIAHPHGSAPVVVYWMVAFLGVVAVALLFLNIVHVWRHVSAWALSKGLTLFLGLIGAYWIALIWILLSYTLA